MIVQCSYCPSKMSRKVCRQIRTCRKCKAKKMTARYVAHKEEVNRYTHEWYLANKDRKAALSRAWEKAHPGKKTKYQRDYRRRERKKNAVVISELRGRCSCGLQHDNLSILRRMLPTTAHEIREAWSCIWGLPNEDDAGARRLYRDLEKLGTVRDGGTFYLQSRAA